MSMNEVRFRLPDGATVRGAVYDTEEPAYLREDLIEIDLPSGWTIDVGWIPHEDPTGSYRIRVFWEYLTGTDRELYTKDRDCLRFLVEQFAAQYNLPSSTSSVSSSSTSSVSSSSVSSTSSMSSSSVSSTSSMSSSSARNSYGELVAA